MLFFGKKKEQNKPVPPGEVERMARVGMSDKDIIKNLKAQGYSYSEIEKAMMSAVKKNVGEDTFGNIGEPSAQPQAQQTQQQQYQPPAKQLPELPELPEGSLEEELGLMEEPELEINPEVIVEELVEGVVEEKWQKFEDSFNKLEDEISKLQTELRQVAQRPLSSAEPHSKEFESKVQELAEQLEELQARVGGLEKAFKQFLPTLTKNIESLSEMIHEMKEKRDIVEA